LLQQLFATLLGSMFDLMYGELQASSRHATYRQTLPTRRPVGRGVGGRIVVRDCSTTTYRWSVSRASAGSGHGLAPRPALVRRDLRRSAACCPAGYGRSCFGNSHERNVTGYLTGELLSDPARNLTGTAPNSWSGCRKDSSENGGPGSPTDCAQDCPQDEGPDDLPDNFADHSEDNPPGAVVESQPQALTLQAASS
jgi:hypothetical protein